MFDPFITLPVGGGDHNDKYLVVCLTADPKVKGNCLLHKFRTGSPIEAGYVRNAWRQGNFSIQGT